VSEPIRGRLPHTGRPFLLVNAGAKHCRTERPSERTPTTCRRRNSRSIFPSRAEVDLEKARAEPPTTTRFFNLDEIQDAGHPEYAEFRDLLCLRLGIRPSGSA